MSELGAQMFFQYFPDITLALNKKLLSNVSFFQYIFDKLKEQRQYLVGFQTQLLLQ